MNVSRLYGTAKTCANDAELLQGDLADVVLIASLAKDQSKHIVSALNHGKAVFAQKPMVTNFEQFAMLQVALAQHPDTPVCIDYHRSFAPFIQKIKSVLEKRTSPLVAHYRMNAGLDQSTQKGGGAGSIIGQACHIIDLLCFLTDARPRAISVEALNVERNDLFPTDNFSATINFDDGSICSLLYTALGNEQLGKERMELFFDSKSIVMDDYKRLVGFGLPPSFDETNYIADRGNEALLTAFFDGLRQQKPLSPIARERLERVVQLTLLIDKLACQGGGSQGVSL